MDLGQQALGSVQLTIDEGRVENQLRLGVGDLRLLPVFDLALHRLEVPLDAVHTYRERVDQVEALAVLGQDRREHAGDNVSEFGCREVKIPGTGLRKNPLLSPASTVTS